VTFRDWLRTARVTRDPAGDFIGDAREDPTFPDARTKAEVLRYLRDCRACDGALAGARVAWRRYLGAVSAHVTTQRRRTLRVNRPRGSYASAAHADPK